MGWLLELSIKLVRYADRTKERRLPVPVQFILDEFPNLGVVPDFKKKLATAIRPIWYWIKMITGDMRQM